MPGGIAARIAGRSGAGDEAPAKPARIAVVGLGPENHWFGFTESQPLVTKVRIATPPTRPNRWCQRARPR
ncbi:hypothetical protein AEGHOMDF_4611 [Methylobacterium soli]|nr:hypothetical protein AEGHOMDF_4611 [Methylobacterium soli]